MLANLKVQDVYFVSYVSFEEFANATSKINK